MTIFGSMVEQGKQGSGCVAVGVFCLILLGIGWVLMPRLLFGYRRPHNAILEARAYVGAMNRAQQAYYLDQSTFATELDSLGLGINPETDYYLYQTQVLNDVAVQNIAVAKREGLYHTIGIVWRVEGGQGDTATNYQLCHDQQRTETALMPPPPRLVRILSWFQPQPAGEIPAGVTPAFEVPDVPVAPDALIPCPTGYTSMR
ncbi:MAG: type IV pilin-like G/H family protein [Cyanobacteria bacterium J06632_22]